jgi:hypothetical protein
LRLIFRRLERQIECPFCRRKAAWFWLEPKGFRRMAELDSIEELSPFIKNCIPSLDAAELIIFLADHPNKKWKPEEIVLELSHRMADLVIKKNIALFYAQGLLAKAMDGTFQYFPNSPNLSESVRLLTRAYNQRPVTLIRMIHAVNDHKIQSFADAFIIKKD